MLKKKKKAGCKLNRSEIVTMRFDPKLRYLADLAARKHRRTLSSYIEWAVQESLKHVCLNDQGRSVQDENDSLWDVTESDRFVMLAFRYPELLNHTEQIKWKLIRETGAMWRGEMKDGMWTWQVEADRLNIKGLRKYWGAFCAVSEGDADASALPGWKGRDLDNG